MVLGGQAGTRLGEELGFSGSRDTILRLIRTTILPQQVSPKKVGIDDWAWKRGHRYGTLVCDLERGIPIDLLPDRTVETVAAWLQKHPCIELISRDGSSEYAVAALKGAPQAIQVSDKWHLLKNLGRAVGLLLTRHFTAHRKKKTQEPGLEKLSVSPRDRSRKISAHQARIQQIHRADRLARYEHVVALAKQGMRRQAIADQVGVGLTTIQDWLLAGSFEDA